jgi:hypothetical protein
MKTSLLLTALLLLAGCGEKSGGTASQTNASGGSVLTAPVDYLGAIGKAQQSSISKIDTLSLDKAIEQFQADKGRNPKDLDELVQDKYISKIPTPPYGMKIDYDADSGQVKVVKQ